MSIHYLINPTLKQGNYYTVKLCTSKTLYSDQLFYNKKWLTVMNCKKSGILLLFAILNREPNIEAINSHYAFKIGRAHV